jgi:hypothetical protein
MDGMQHELSRTLHQRLLHQGFDYDIRVTCRPSGQVLTYSCDVLVTNPPPKHHVEWTETVVCRAREIAGIPRCSSSPTGEALQ